MAGICFHLLTLLVYIKLYGSLYKEIYASLKCLLVVYQSLDSAILWFSMHVSNNAHATNCFSVQRMMFMEIGDSFSTGYQSG